MPMSNTETGQEAEMNGAASGDVSRRTVLQKSGAITGALAVGGIGGIAGTTAAQPNGNGNSKSDALVVDDNGNAEYQTVQAAVDDAGQGDDIIVRPGEYEGGVTLDNAGVTLSGRGTRPSQAADKLLSPSMRMA